MGFGSGLNFLTTWKAWSKIDYHNKELHFYSIENNPLKKEDAKRILSEFEDLKPFVNAFLNLYPINCKGVQRIYFREHNVYLTILFRDIDESISTLTSLTHNFDAWYLDGFSPDRNPSMWSEKILKTLQICSNQNTSFSTFSSSSLLKKNLNTVGAEVSIVKGFAKKKHMISGILKGKKSTSIRKNKKVAIIGAGIAGCSLAHSLSKRGHNSVIFEKKNDLCLGASGINALIGYPRLSAFNSTFARFLANSYIYATRFYESLNSTGWNKTGVLILDTNELSNKRIKELSKLAGHHQLYKVVSAEEGSKISGIELTKNGLFFPSSGWIDPYKICKDILDESGAELHFNEEVLSIAGTGRSPRLLTAINDYDFDAICLCNSYEANTLASVEGIHIKRGQLTHIAPNKYINGLKTPLCGKGYISPLINNHHIIGSTYSNDVNLQPSKKDNLKNLSIFEDIFNNSIPEKDIKNQEVGLRATTLDFLPIAGKGPNVYLNICHGSRGSLSAPFCSEYLADLITGTPHLLEKDTVDAISWNRFNLKS